jgi:hypothetical protein
LTSGQVQNFINNEKQRGLTKEQILDEFRNVHHLNPTIEQFIEEAFKEEKSPEDEELLNFLSQTREQELSQQPQNLTFIDRAGRFMRKILRGQI